MNTALGRIQKDLLECYNYQNPDSPPIFVKPRDDKLEIIDALIVGPPDTPYEFGFFCFELRFPATYPNAPPKCAFVTTDGGRVRMNPNLYSNGKVCLSILGTWTGEAADEWRSSYSLLYVLQAIQSLILTSTPYHNEPGYEHATPDQQDEVKAYTDKILHESLRVAVCGALEECLKPSSSHPFRDIVKNLFLLWHPRIARRVEQQLALNPQPSGEFPAMPFEYPENIAKGRYDYSAIMSRLSAIKVSLENETENMKPYGKALTASASGWRYLKLKDENELRKRGIPLEGVDAGPVSEDNLFYWQATIFGPEGTLWEGGIYNIEIVFGDGDTPPRVKFLTEVFHPHVNRDGVPFLLIDHRSNKEPVMSILKAVVALLKNPYNSSPATWANIEAATMYFSKDPEQMREYKRRVARCVRLTVE